MSRHRSFKDIYWIFELDPDFPWKTCSDKLPSQFSQKSWFHKNHPYFAHNSTPVGANVCEIKTTPQNRSFSRCSFRQTTILTGSNDRIEPNYFLYRDVDFLAENKNVFFWFPWVRMASLGFSGMKKQRKNEFYIEKIKFLPIFLTIFYDEKNNFFTKKWAGNLGISSETTWESRVRRPGNLEWDDLGIP